MGSETQPEERTDRLLLSGPTSLSGQASVSGFKHSLVTAVAAAVLAPGLTTLENVPAIAETAALGVLLEQHGVDVVRVGPTLTLDSSSLQPGKLDPAIAGAIHGSIYLAPAMLSRFGSIELPVPGGCAIGDGASGARPIRHYVEVLERFGATHEVHADGTLELRARALRGADLDLAHFATHHPTAGLTGPCYSGATKYALLAAAAAQGTSTIRNPYPKPDVTDMVEMLRSLGADIEMSPNRDAWVVEGTGLDSLGEGGHLVLMADLIELVTWITAGALLGDGALGVTGTRLGDAISALEPEINVLRRMGVPFDVTGDRLVVGRFEAGRPVDVVVASRGVFSDSQPFLVLLAAACDGVSSFEETVWSGRFDHVAGLQALGARVRVRGASLQVEGRCVPARSGQELTAGDLRSAAVLTIAALLPDGTNVLDGADHLRRGYPDLPGDLERLGANIEQKG